MSDVAICSARGVIARVIRFDLLPFTRAAFAGVLTLARPVAAAVAVAAGWRWRWRSVTPRATRVARAHTPSPRIARVITAPLPRCHPHARARQRRRRFLVCSLARARGGGGGGVGGGGRLNRASRVAHTPCVSLVMRAHAHIITASRASSQISVPPAHDRHARAAAAAALAQSPDHAHTVWRWQRRWRLVTLSATRVTRARTHVITAHRARHHRPFPRFHPCARAAFARSLICICCCVCRHAAHRTCARDLGALVSATPPCMTPHPLCNTHGTHATHNTTRR